MKLIVHLGKRIIGGGGGGAIHLPLSPLSVNTYIHVQLYINLITHNKVILRNVEPFEYYEVKGFVGAQSNPRYPKSYHLTIFKYSKNDTLFIGLCITKSIRTVITDKSLKKLM